MNHVRKNCGAYYWPVGPLQSLTSPSPGKHFWTFLADEEVEESLLSKRMDMNEATGRVFLWGWCGAGPGTEIFIEDLV